MRTVSMAKMYINPAQGLESGLHYRLSLVHSACMFIPSSFRADSLFTHTTAIHIFSVAIHHINSGVNGLRVTFIRLGFFFFLGEGGTGGGIMSVEISPFKSRKSGSLSVVKDVRDVLVTTPFRSDGMVTLATADRLFGLVVKTSTSRAEDPGFESRLRRDFSGVESYQ